MQKPINSFGPAQAQIDAHCVVNDPQACADSPSLRLLAWAIMKAARGQTIHQAQMNRLRMTGGA